MARKRPTTTKEGYHKVTLVSQSSYIIHVVYLRQDKVEGKNEQQTQLIPGRTLYVVNVPNAMTEEELEQMFTDACGDVQSIDLGKPRLPKETLARSAHVVFKSEKGLKHALELTEIAYEKQEKEEKDYKEEYLMARPELTELQEEADEFMQAFDAKEEEEARRREELKNAVDDDGFQTVVYTKRKAAELDVRSARHKKKLKSYELKDFYRFQVRENKQEKLRTLREKFQQDAKKIEQMKKAKMFVPEE